MTLSEFFMNFAAEAITPIIRGVHMKQKELAFIVAVFLAVVALLWLGYKDYLRQQSLKHPKQGYSESIYPANPSGETRHE